MSSYDLDLQYAVDMASEEYQSGEDFTRAVGLASRFYNVPYADICKALSAHSAIVRRKVMKQKTVTLSLPVRKPEKPNVLFPEYEIDQQAGEAIRR